MGGRSRRGILVGVCGVVLLASLVFGGCDGGGPRPLSDTQYWRGQLGNGNGVDTVVAQGSAAVPLLNALLADSNENVVNSAALAASMIGEAAAGTTPALLGALASFPNQPMVKDALKSMKGSAVPYLLPMLQGGDEKKQMQAAEVLVQMGQAAEPAMDALMAIIEGSSASKEIKEKALVAMGGIGEPAVPLITRLNDFALANDDLKNSAAMAIKRIKYAKRVRLKGGNK